MYSFTKSALCTGALSSLNIYWLSEKCLATTGQRLLSYISKCFLALMLLYTSVKVPIPFKDTHLRSWYLDVVAMADTQFAHCIFRRLFSLYKLFYFFQFLSGFHHWTPIYSSHDQQSSFSSPYTIYTKPLCWPCDFFLGNPPFVSKLLDFSLYGSGTQSMYVALINNTSYIFESSSSIFFNHVRTFVSIFVRRHSLPFPFLLIFYMSPFFNFFHDTTYCRSRYS